MHDIYRLKEMLCEELEEYGKKGEVTAGSLEVIQKLSDTVKNLGKIIWMHEHEEDDSYSSMYDPYDRRMYRDERYGGMSYARGGRGRGRNTRGDSMGRYSSERGYSMADDEMKDVIEDMRGMMNDLPQEKKMEVQRFIQKMEQM